MANFIIQKEGTGFVELLKSKFYSFAFPVNDVEVFKTRLEEIRKANHKAKHIVYAYRIGVNSKSTDDKEPKGTAGRPLPKGTAGRPLLELLTKKNLVDSAIIVVRYFGGSELGASRLLRTYLASGVDAINHSTIVEK